MVLKVGLIKSWLLNILEIFITNATRSFFINMSVFVIALFIRREIKLRKLENFITYQILFKKSWMFIEFVA